MTTWATAPAITEQTLRERSRQQGEPDWLLKRRQDAWRAFEAMALPNPLEEEWRRTDISGLDLDAVLDQSSLRDSSRRLTSKPARLPRDLASKKDIAGLLVQNDGATVSRYAGDLAGSVVFSDLQKAAREQALLVEEHLHGLVRPTEWKLQALEAALWQGGAFVYVPRGVEVTLPLRYASTLSGGPSTGSGHGLLCPHLLVIAEENSSVTVIQESFSADALRPFDRLRVSGQGERQSLVSGAVEIVCRPNARVRYLDVQRWGSGVFSFSTVRARLDRGAQLTAALVGLGSRLAKTKLEVTLAGEGASTELLGLSFGDGGRHFDYNTLQNHIAPRTSSDLLFKAALTDRASQVWYGTVRIQKGAGQSEANQTSRNLLLSEQAKAAPIPVLEIEAYDVLRCSHGATAGPLDEDQRFYLESRGIPPAEAERLLVEAFFCEVLDRMPAAAVRESVAKTLLEKLEAGR